MMNDQRKYIYCQVQRENYGNVAGTHSAELLHASDCVVIILLYHDGPR